MDRWTEIRTALHVARLGTITESARALGVHRATVVRHIQTLEEELGGPLFERRPKGYLPTEIGLQLLRVAEATEQHFLELKRSANMRQSEIAGEITITSIAVLAPALMPAIAEYQRRHPLVSIRYLTDKKLLKLEYGEADIAIRAGSEPIMADHTVRKMSVISFALYAHRDYLARRGEFKGLEDIPNHAFVTTLSDGPGPVFYAWIAKHVPEKCIVFRGPQERIIDDALFHAIGISFFPVARAKMYPDLVQVLPSDPEWDIPVWLVTHNDTGYSRRVTEFLKVLNEFKPDFSFATTEALVKSGAKD